MRLCLDTNRYCDLCRGDPDVGEQVAKADAVYVPFVVVAELRAGFAMSQRSHENERVLQRFLMKPGVDVLYPSDATTRSYATLFRQLRHQGTPMPTNDLWIAALVVENDLALSSRDRHFATLPQLDLV